MTLHQTIKAHIKESMIAKDETRTMVLRGVQAEIQKDLIAKKSSATEATDDEALAIIKKLVKQRKDSIDQFTKGGRPELAESEKAELKVLETYLPATMPKDEIKKIAMAKKDEKGVTDSTLFNTAGMQPLVPFLLGEPHSKGKRLVDVQKCLRTVDIDDVGDKTHATFFEMLGNWSLGDYFKKEAIEWSYEFLTSDKEGLSLDPKRLYITVFEGDQNAVLMTSV